MSDVYIRTGRFLQYTGTNGAQMSAWFGSPIISDNGQVLVLGVNPAEPAMRIVKNDWYSDLYGQWNHADFTREWTLRSSLAGTPDGVGTMDAVSVQVPLLILGGGAERPIVWSRPFSNNGYKVTFLPDANTIGRITATVKNGTKTATGLTVVISAGLAVTVAGVLHVVGTS